MLFRSVAAAAVAVVAAQQGEKPATAARTATAGINKEAHITFPLSLELSKGFPPCPVLYYMREKDYMCHCPVKQATPLCRPL